MNKFKKQALFALAGAAFLLGCGEDPSEIFGGTDVTCLLATGQCNKMKPATCLDLSGQSVEQCPSLGNNPGGDINGTISSNDGLCSLDGKLTVCQWDDFGCANIDSDYEGRPCADLIANCTAWGKLFTGVPAMTEDNGWGAGLQCANLGGTQVAGGTVADGFCYYESKRAYCGYGNGSSCYEITNGGDAGSNSNAGIPCADLLDKCSREGDIFTGVNPAALNQSNSWGAGVNCAANGGTQVASSSSSNITITTSSSSVNVIIDGVITGTGKEEDCKHNGKKFFCEWEDTEDKQGGCWAGWGTNEDITCEEYYSICKARGIFYDLDDSKLTEENGWGDGFRCADLVKSSSNGASGITGDNIEDHCRYNGKKFFCEWEANGDNPGGCWVHSNNSWYSDGKTCAELYNNCENNGKLFYDVDEEKIGDGKKCSDIGGTPGYTSGLSGDDGEYCRYNGEAIFCQYTKGCYRQSHKYDPSNNSCATLVANCKNYDGQLFIGVDNSKLTEDNGFGDDISCSDNGGTPITIN